MALMVANWLRRMHYLESLHVVLYAVLRKADSQVLGGVRGLRAGAAGMMVEEHHLTR